MKPFFFFMRIGWFYAIQVQKLYSAKALLQHGSFLKICVSTLFFLSDYIANVLFAGCLLFTLLKVIT